MKRASSFAFSVVCLATILGAGDWSHAAAEAPVKISIVTDSAPGRATRHGLTKLAGALEASRRVVQQTDELRQADGTLVVLAGLAAGPGAAATCLKEIGDAVPARPESLLVRRTQWRGQPTLLLCGADDRGLMYALLDTADRVAWAANGGDPFREVRDAQESPDVAERGLSIYTMHRATFEERLFNEEYWASYFDMLARDRFNSFVLIFGYENGGYFAPAYPYFFDVEGFPDVRVVNFTAGQQQRYLTALNRLIRMAHDRGLNFTAGLWDHIYRGGVQSGGVKEADPNRLLPGVPAGLTKTNLMAYSTAALAKFLRLVPELDAVQFRMHSESGLKPGEEMREFWKNIYQVVKDVRPALRFEARVKEFPDELIDLALQMGINLRLSTKYWAEQMGLPFHPTHVNRQNQMDRRHGYANLLRYPQRYKMHWQLWSGGTSRVLLWGDPEYVRQFAASTHLYNGDSFEVNEMLATKMEAQPHDQKTFELLRPSSQYYRWEFERYWHFYQVFGRISFNPKTPPEIWQREFQRRFGTEAAPYVEQALHRASWILPRLNASVFPYGKFPTTRGWVEKQRWEDLPAYAGCEGSDTQQFQSFAEAAQDRLAGTDSAKLHPEQNSAWFAQVSREILENVAAAERGVGSHRNKEFDSTMVDLRILAKLALYHARRIHAGLNYALFRQSQDLNAFDDAIAQERLAIQAWEELVQAAGDVYNNDLMMGLRSAGLSGHWKDELAALQTGLAALTEQRARFQSKPGPTPRIAHVPIRKSNPGDAVEIRATVFGPSPLKSVRLAWRVGDGAYNSLAMQSAEPLLYRASLPGSGLKGQASYYIEAEDNTGARIVFPPDGAKQPITIRIASDHEPPRLEHTPIATAVPGQPLRIRAKVSDPAGVNWVRLRYRGVTQYQDYQSLELQPTGRNDEFEAIVPGDQIAARWDFMYLFEVMDKNGNGKIYPDLNRETPYVIVKLQEH